MQTEIEQKPKHPTAAEFGTMRKQIMARREEISRANWAIRDEIAAEIAGQKQQQEDAVAMLDEIAPDRI